MLWKIALEFSTVHLSEEGWVVDFGGFKELRSLLEDRFDHKTLIAEDDPYLDEICALAGVGVLDPVVVPGVGMEAFCLQVAEIVWSWLRDSGLECTLSKVEVREHGGNAATLEL